MEMDVCPILPTVISHDIEKNLSAKVYSKEERLDYNAQHKQPRRKRRGDSGYSGSSSASVTLNEDEMHLVLQSEENGNLTQKYVQFEYTKSLKPTQRPQYANDGSRGCIKCEDGSPVTITVDLHLPIRLLADQRLVCTLKVGLTNASGLPAKHFEVYSNNLYQTKPENNQHVFIFGNLKEGKNEISLDRIGIKRKDEERKVGKLEKDCRLTSSLYLLDAKTRQVFFCGQITSDTLTCEQDAGPPVLLDMVPKQSSTEGGGVLMIKGKNFSPGITQVFFAGNKEYECRLARNMASKNMQVCYIPHSQDVVGEFVEVFVRIGDKQTASLKFQYMSSNTGPYKENNFHCMDCQMPFEGSFGRYQNPSLSNPGFTTVYQSEYHYLAKDQKIPTDMVYPGEVESSMEYEQDMGISQFLDVLDGFKSVDGSGLLVLPEDEILITDILYDGEGIDGTHVWSH